MAWQLALEKVLEVAQPAFTCDQARWAIVGSVASALQGGEVLPRDLDLLAVTPEEVYHFAERMASYTPQHCEHPPGHAKWRSSEEMPLDVGPDDYGFLWHFGRWEAAGLTVEMAHIVAPEGFPTSKDGAGIWEAGPEIWPHVRQATFAGHLVALVPLEIQIETNLQRGLEERAAGIIAVLKRDGYDGELVRKALTGEHQEQFEALMDA
jgi:hypothetical protein